MVAILKGAFGRDLLMNKGAHLSTTSLHLSYVLKGAHFPLLYMNASQHKTQETNYIMKHGTIILTLMCGNDMVISLVDIWNHKSLRGLIYAFSIYMLPNTTHK